MESDHNCLKSWDVRLNSPKSGVFSRERLAKGSRFVVNGAPPPSRPARSKRGLRPGCGPIASYRDYTNLQKKWLGSPGILWQKTREFLSVFFRFFFFSCFYHLFRQSLGEFGLFGPWAACDVLCVKRKKGCVANCVVSWNRPRWGKDCLFEIRIKNPFGYFEFEKPKRILYGYFK